VTTAGTLTQISVVATASGNNVAACATVVEGPFAAPPIDANPANVIDVTSPYTCPSTGTLAQANEVVIGWMCGTGNGTHTASAPGTLDRSTISQAIIRTSIQRIVVTATTAVAPEFTASAVPTDACQGTMSFKRAAEDTATLLDKWYVPLSLPVIYDWGAEQAFASTLFFSAVTGAYTTTISPGSIPIAGASVSPVFATTESITAGSVPITGQTVTAVLGFTDAIVAGSVPITGQTVAPVFAITETISSGSIPITGQLVTPAFGRVTAITASAIPIDGQTVTPVRAFSDTIVAGSVPITGQAVAPVFNITESITAASVPISGQIVTPVLGYTDTIVAGSVPITGQTVAPVFNITEAITAGSVPIDGQSITPVHGEAGEFSTSIEAGSIPITGQDLAPVFSITEAITAAAVPIDGQEVIASIGLTEAIDPASIPIDGQEITPVHDVAGYTTEIEPASLPIEGAEIIPVWSGEVAEPGRGGPVVEMGAVERRRRAIKRGADRAYWEQIREEALAQARAEVKAEAKETAEAIQEVAETILKAPFPEEIPEALAVELGETAFAVEAMGQQPSEIVALSKVAMFRARRSRAIMQVIAELIAEEDELIAMLFAS
jgi:hypothetical protein